MSTALRKLAVILVVSTALLAAALLPVRCGSRAHVASVRPDPSAPAGGRIRGVGWVAGGEIEAADLDSVLAVSGDWIAQTPFGWQKSIDRPGLRLVTGGNVLWGETDRGLEVTTRLAHERGLKVLLKPHVWVGGQWRGELAMGNEEDWRQWFGEYERFALHYARLAERLDIEAFAVGTELHRTLVERPDDWRRIIARVREVYSGHLTYSANWSGEIEDVSFWDALDSIGVQGYFPLADHERPSLETLVAGWAPHLQRLEALHRRTGRPVLFTELGYRSTADAAIEPWRWPGKLEGLTTRADPETQARCYEAFFRAVWGKPWVAGAFVWKWYPNHRRAGGESDIGFTPQNKPAEQILAAWYSAADSTR